MKEESTIHPGFWMRGRLNGVTCLEFIENAPRYEEV